jgi:formate C-acetyltransferase
LTGALPNGRKKGVALTDASVSAMPGTDTNGSTALIKSAAQAIDTIRNNCNHMNMKFIPSALEGPNGSRLLLNLVKTYFSLGGGHIQFNCVDAETLYDAKKNPQDHKDLVVRVAGFSSYFTRLYEGVQDEIIKRTEYKC